MKRRNTAPAFNLLKILTLADVNGMVTTTGVVRTKVSLTDMIVLKFAKPKSSTKKSEATQEETVQTAKVLQFMPDQGEVTEVKKVQEIESSDPDKIERIKEKEVVELKEADLLSKMSDYLSGEKVEESIEHTDSSEEIDRNVFILESQRKLKQTRRKMKTKEIYNLYSKSSAVEVHHHDEKDEDIIESTTCGVLINKKQY